MSNREVAFYMVPASCFIAAALIAEGCYDAGKLWLPIVLIAIAVITLLVKKIVPTRRQAKVGTHRNRAYYSTGRR